MKKVSIRPVTVILAWSIFCILFLSALIYIYLAQPFSGQGNNIASNLFIVVAAGISAVAATVLWLQHDPEDPPRRIWRYFSFGLWAWVAGDTIWMVYNLTLVEVPTFSLADTSYLAGYCFLAAALHRQYRILYRPSRRKDLALTLLIVTALLLGTLLVQLAALEFNFHQLTPSGYLNFLYAAGELAIAVVALIYSLNFRRGALARPWFGLAIFALADAFYAWLIESGSYAYSLADGNLPSLIADASYTAAYLVLTLGLIMHLLLVKYGLKPLKASLEH